MIVLLEIQRLPRVASFLSAEIRVGSWSCRFAGCCLWSVVCGKGSRKNKFTELALRFGLDLVAVIE